MASAQRLDWDAVEAQLLDVVFYAHDPQKVRNARDLPSEGLLDSLSVVAIMEVLADAFPAGSIESLDSLKPSDFQNMTSIRALYQRL